MLSTKAILLLFLGVSSLCADNLVWSDEFNELNFDTWQHEITAGGGGNWEFEYYTNNRSNSFTENGVLHLRPTLTADRLGEDGVRRGQLDLWGAQPADLCTGNAFYGCYRDAAASGNYLNPIQSARLRTAKSFGFMYGRMEVRAKLPKGDWIWPAIWLLPSHQAYGEWPASGEIDLVESRGNANGYPGGVDTFSSTLHWGPFWPIDPEEKTHGEYQIPGTDFSQDFHVFGLVWNEKYMYTYIDDPSRIVLNVTIDRSFWNRGGWENSGLDNPWKGRGDNAPFDQKFFIILNVAVGGTNGYFPDGVGGKPWSNNSPNAANQFWDSKGQWYPTWTQPDLMVDYIRIYQ